MRRWFHWLILFLKWLIAAAILVEVLAFLIVTLSIYWIYGQLREGEAARYDPYALYLNINGPRPTANNPLRVDPKTQKIIWMFGGSTTRGVTDFDELTIPSHLARIFNQEEPRLPAQVANFGVDGFNGLMETKYLQKMLIESPYAPNVIIFYDGANDCAYFAQHRTPEAHHGYDRLKGLVESYHHSFFGLFKSLNSALYGSFVKELYDKMRQGVMPIEADSPDLKEYVDQAVKRYDYVAKVAGCFGARFYLFWQPAWWVESRPPRPSVREREEQEIILTRHLALRHNFMVVYQALYDRLRDKPYFVDFRDVLEARTEPMYQADGIHLTDGGRELVAKNMGQVIKTGLLAAEPRQGPMFRQNAAAPPVDRPGQTGDALR